MSQHSISSVNWTCFVWSHWVIFSVSTDWLWYWKISVRVMSWWFIQLKIIMSVLNFSTIIINTIIVRPMTLYDTSDNVCLDRYLIYTFYVYDNNNSLSDHQSSPDVKCPFSSCLCIFCSSTIYGFWLPLWYVLAIANTMVLMSSVNKVGIMHRGWASINRSVETGLSVVFWAFLNQIFCPVNFAKIAYSSSATNNSFVYKQNQIWNTMRASMKLLTKWL